MNCSPCGIIRKVPGAICIWIILYESKQALFTHTARYFLLERRLSQTPYRQKKKPKKKSNDPFVDL